MKLGIIGSRSFLNENLLTNYLFKYYGFQEGSVYNFNKISEIVSGGAKGVDTLAANFAKKYSIKLIEFKPEYDKYPGKIAPLIRNEEIVKYCDELFCIWDGISRGTQNALGHAKRLKKNTIIIYF